MAGGAELAELEAELKKLNYLEFGENFFYRSLEKLDILIVI